MKVIENFLSKEDFNKIESSIINPFFPWFLQNGVNKSKDGNMQLIHIFFSEEAYVNSSYFDLIKPILKKLSVKSLLRVKANLLHKTEKIIEHGFHRDFPYENNTAIFYLNTNNGYTKFKNKKIIKSEKNKLVDFNSSLEHTGSTCTDEDYRIVINFNYF
jgi:hypothetical protein